MTPTAPAGSSTATRGGRNVIVFGETGVGKSSVINLICGEGTAKTDSGAKGCTFESNVYRQKIGTKMYNLYDTVGLGEHSTGTVEASKAIGNLYNLVKQLANSGGVHLLVFVIKCGRVTETMWKNYVLFFKGFCEEKIPILIAVTCCENCEPTMDDWWVRNEAAFTAAKMEFHGHACLCAHKGRCLRREQTFANEELVEESRTGTGNFAWQLAHSCARCALLRAAQIAHHMMFARPYTH